jgi:hypothetical protein
MRRNTQVGRNHPGTTTWRVNNSSTSKQIYWSSKCTPSPESTHESAKLMITFFGVAWLCLSRRAVVRRTVGEFRMVQDMRVVSLVAIFLLAPSPGYPASNLSGIWTLNHTKSNFGKVIAPEQFVVRMERTDGRLATWRITTDPDGQHLVYRVYALEGKQRSTYASIVFPTESTGGTRTSERWQVSKGRLIVRRSIITGARTVHQRLVLDPSTGVQGTNQVP